MDWRDYSIINTQNPKIYETQGNISILKLEAALKTLQHFGANAAVHLQLHWHDVVLFRANHNKTCTDICTCSNPSIVVADN